MRTLALGLALLLAPLPAAAQEDGRDVDERGSLSLRLSSREEPVLNRANLIRVKEFILAQGKRETFSNMYNDNPAFHVGRYAYYLIPDTGQENIDCDPKRSDFNRLMVRDVEGGRDQYREIDFRTEHDFLLTVSYPTRDTTAGQVRQLAEQATEAILAKMKSSIDR